MQSHTMRDGVTTWRDDKGNHLPIANFEARIIEEYQYIDGDNTSREYRIQGRVNKEDTAIIGVSAEAFAGLHWPATNWGSQAIIYPRPGAKEQLRTAIQLESDPIVRQIYTHTGWATIGGKPYYLVNGGAIGQDGHRTDLTVNLPPDLRHYAFCVTPPGGATLQDAIKASIALAALPPHDIGWAVLGALYRCPVSPIDFAVHITGRTGTYKSEYAALIQSHWGSCDARQLPASWSSTANALEALAYRAKDAVMVVDDFIPLGTSWQIKTYQKTADQLIRAQGNQAGRARLTDTSRLQQTMYPRGLIFSTGEDTPEGHSVRARMLIAELAPDDISPRLLTKAQANRPLYSMAMAGYLQWLARDLPRQRARVQALAIKVRDANLTLGHARTPPTLGSIAAGLTLLFEFAVDSKVLAPAAAKRKHAEAIAHVKRLAIQQTEYIQASDPADQFVAILRGILAANAAHIRTKAGGIPKHALVLGWTNVGDVQDMEFKPHGPRLGWADTKLNTLYLDAAIAYDVIRRHSRGAITITRQTLYKRLREAGHLTKTDDTRHRNTVRVQLEHASRQVLAIKLQLITEGNQL